MFNSPIIFQFNFLVERWVDGGLSKGISKQNCVGNGN